jgi:hypothetical protein
MIRNTIELEITEGEYKGKKVGFRTGTFAWGMAIRESGCVTNEEYVLRLASEDVHAANALFFASAVQYAQYKGLPVDFTPAIVTEWVEDLGEDKARQLTTKLLESYVPKNSAPRKEPGQASNQQSMTGSSLQSQNVK